MIRIRPAEPKDCSAMMQLIKELAEYELAPDEVSVSMEHFIESGFGLNPVWWAFVAEHQAGIVGMALYYIRYSTWKGQRMYLEDIIVSNAYRRQGIGGMLLEQLISEAKRKSFVGMNWQVLDWNQPAIDFYKKYSAKFDATWLNVSLDF